MRLVFTESIMKPEQTILYSDLDGTLFSSNGGVSAENCRAVEAYIAAGGMFAIATGREPANALMFIGELKQNAPAIVVNGCGVYDFEKREYLYCRFLDREGLLPFLRKMLADFPDMELQAYTERGICYCTPEETAHPQLLAMHNPRTFTTLDALEDVSFFKCFLYAPMEREPALMEKIAQGEASGLFRHVPGTTDVGGPITYHEFLPPDASKGCCVRWLREHPPVRGRTILAVGDFWNDYELLEEADIAIAPSNAIDEIKAICQYETVSHNEHAIKHIIEDIIPKL